MRQVGRKAHVKTPRRLQTARRVAGRLIPFLRGYVSVAAGILSIRPKIFMPVVIVSAITWSGGYVIAGRLLGPYWEQVARKIGGMESLVLLATLIAIDCDAHWPRRCPQESPTRLTVGRTQFLPAGVPQGLH